MMLCDEPAKPMSRWHELTTCTTLIPACDGGGGGGVGTGRGVHAPPRRRRVAHLAPPPADRATVCRERTAVARTVVVKHRHPPVRTQRAVGGAPGAPPLGRHETCGAAGGAPNCTALAPSEWLANVAYWSIPHNAPPGTRINATERTTLKKSTQLSGFLPDSQKLGVEEGAPCLLVSSRAFAGYVVCVHHHPKH